MGNRRDRGYVAALARALGEEEDPVVRAHAAWALGEIGGAEAVAVLEGALEGEGEGQGDPEVRREIVAALEALAQSAGRAS
jgi:epoxyqueuosine reductase